VPAINGETSGELWHAVSAAPFCSRPCCCHAGAVSFWNAEDRHLEEDSKTHRQVITSLTWSPAGDRLLTSDENGKASAFTHCARLWQGST
jgi:WD40 repeat protein